MTTANAIVEMALTIQADRKRIGMPISVIEAVRLATNPPAAPTSAEAIATAAQTLMVERDRIGMPISYIEAVNLVTAGPAAPDSAAGIAVAAHGLVAERNRIGMPISYIDAVSEVRRRTTHAATSPIQAAASAEPIYNGGHDLDRDAEAAVAAAVVAGKVLKNSQDWALSYAKRDIVGFKAFVERAPSLGGDHDGTKGAPSKRPEQIAGEIVKAAENYQAEQAKQGLTVDIIAAVDAVKASVLNAASAA